MKAFGITDKGKKRSINEDNYFILNDDNYMIFAISDGMGGHNAGDVASKIVVNSIAEFCFEFDILNNIEANLRKLISFCNYNVNKLAIENKTLSGMGATVVIGLMTTDKVYVANLGDSRAYIIKDDEIFQISEDHSFVNELIKGGVLTDEEAKYHPRRNEITKAIGIVLEVFPDIFEVDIKKGDLILLCSDGLSNMVENEKIKEIVLNSKDIDTALNLLVCEANDNGGADNITVVLTKF